MKNVNPLTRMDYPDPDVIRLDDTYYMISTTMYFMPGGVILRSYDLAHWEIATYLFDELDGTPAERLEMGLTTYAVKVVVAALDTPFLYMARRLAPERAWWMEATA